MTLGDELRQITKSSLVTHDSMMDNIRKNFESIREKCLSEAKKGKFSYTFGFENKEEMNFQGSLQDLTENLSSLLLKEYGLTCSLHYLPNDRFVTGSGLSITLYWGEDS